MRTVVITILLALMSGTAAPAAPKKVQVVTTLNVLAAVTREVGGDRVSVSALAKPNQDPHTLVAKPTYKLAAKNADLFVELGLGLDIWGSAVTDASGNPNIQTGQKGRVVASEGIETKELPATLSKAWGDIHPQGNPHVHLDPRNIAKIAEVVSARFAELDSRNADTYHARGADFGKRWQQAMDKWRAQAEPLKGMPIVVYHKDVSYFINWAGMREAGALEPKPGIPPTPAHLAELVDQMKRAPAKAIVYSPYNNPAAAQFLSQRTGIPVVPVPFTVGGTPKAKDLFGLFDDTIERLAAVTK